MELIDFIIDEKECNLTTFDYYLFIDIKSVTLRSILFYNSWNIIDFLDPEIALLTLSLNKTITTAHKIEYDADIAKPPNFCSSQLILKENMLLVISEQILLILFF
jgi:hypothetical protein